MTASTHSSPLREVLLGVRAPSVEDIHDLATGRARAVLDPDPVLRERLAASAAMVEQLLTERRRVYGITTGYGASAEFDVVPEVAEILPLHLLRYHGCGTGAALSEVESAAVVAVRAASLSRGYSGVTVALLERMMTLLERRILPRIPEEGSVGASGDLTPLSYLAATLVGEREVLFEGATRPASEVLAEAGLTPLTLRPKEGLALMNGTAMMAALGCLSWVRAERLGRLAALESAMACAVLDGAAGHYDDRIFALKPHPGQRATATAIRASLEGSSFESARVQDPYSMRCSPHVVGLLFDALPFTRALLETEVLGVDDNPLLDPETGSFLHGGNFYGGHACLATDTLKNVCANVADLLDRQLSLLNNPHTNAGLPANLVARQGEDRFTHHGFKAMEITASALTAEALKMTMPASVFSRSTESHNQDKVSMGAISAREARRVLDLSETVAVIHLLALVQAMDLRGLDRFGAPLLAMHAAVRARVPMNVEDRRMDLDIEAMLGALRADELPLPAVDMTLEASGS